MVNFVRTNRSAPAKVFRSLETLVPGGTLIYAATTHILPGSVLRGEEEYPHDIAAEAAAREVGLLAVDAEELALEAGSARAVNIALLGAASIVLPFSAEAWQQGLAAAVPAKILAVNERAFALGRDAVSQEVAP